MKNRNWMVILVVVILAVSVIGCSGDNKLSEQGGSQSEDKVIVVGGTSISNVFYDAIKEKYEEEGYKTEFKIFDSNQVVLEALASGDIDLAIGQHKKYVLSFNENNNANLDMVKPYGMYTGIGLYSERHNSISEFPDGSQIAVMNDAMNEDIALRILEDEGLIKISENVKFSTVADIVENKKNLEIIEMDQAQTVTALEDMAGATIFFTHMSASGKDPDSYIARDKEMINYPMGAIARGEDIEADWAVDFAKKFRDVEVQKEILDVYPNVFEFYTNDNQVIE